MPLPGVGSPPHEQKHVCLLFLWSHIFCCITYLQWDGSADCSHPSKKGWGQKWNEMEWNEMVRDQKNESAHFEYFDSLAAQVPFLSFSCWIPPPPLATICSLPRSPYLTYQIAIWWRIRFNIKVPLNARGELGYEKFWKWAFVADISDFFVTFHNFFDFWTFFGSVSFLVWFVHIFVTFWHFFVTFPHFLWLIYIFLWLFSHVVIDNFFILTFLRWCAWLILVNFSTHIWVQIFF